MQFKIDGSETVGQDIVSEINALCDSNSTSYPIADKVRRVNAALENLIGKLLGSDGTWQWDDTNYTTVPRGTGNLVEGQESYSFASEYLQIEHVDVLIDSSPDMWRRLKPLDREELGNLTTEEYFGLTSAGNPRTGTPEYFDIDGDSIRIFPAPTSTAVTLTAGLRISFRRTADLLTTTDTTQEPGLPSPYHITLAYMAAIPYCMVYKKDRVALYQLKVNEDIKDMLKFFGKREKSKRKIMTMKEISYF